MSLYEQAKQLREERKGLSEVLLAIPREAENGKLSAEQREKFDKIDKDIQELDESIERVESALEQERKMAAVEPLKAANRETASVSEPPKYEDSLRRWATDEATAEDRSVLGVKTNSKGSYIDIKLPDFRAQSVGTDSEGGYLRPEGFWPELRRAMLMFGGILENARVVRTATGAVLPIPTVDDTSNTGEDVSENAEVAEQDVTFSEKQLDAYKLGSGLIRVSHEFLNDSAFPVDGLIGSLLGERLGRRLNTRATTGTGSSQANGYVTASTAGTTTASATAVTYSEILGLIHAVDPAYRASPNFRVAFNDSSLLALKQLGVGSSDARPLWQPGMAVGEPNTIDGKRYFINQDMADIGSSAKAFVAGDFSQFWVRLVEDVRLLRLNERFGEFDQVGFVAFLRMDSELATGSTKALYHLPQKA